MLATTAPLSLNELVAHFGYIASILMFMFGIMLLGKVRTARRGNMLAAGAMLVAVVSQLVQMGTINWVWIVIGFVVGGLVGAAAATRVQMTQMPEMVALFNGSGGLASALVAFAAYAFGGLPAVPLHAAAIGGSVASDVNGLAVMLSILIGCVTFTGSIIAFLKLAEKIDGKPILLPARHAVNIVLGVLVLLFTVLAVWFVGGIGGAALIILVAMIALLLGISLVIPIGGGDMPVVISLLNSYSGIAAAMAGFALNSHVLIVSGSLVGAAGLILTQIMCKAMNRSLANVIFGGFGAEASAGGGGEYKDVKNVDPESAAMALADASSVIIVPGYGMAVAQAQHAVREMASILEAKGVNVRYAIHPVAGRMPGHMNVLLAEASVPYEQLFEMDEINDDFKTADVAMVIGANDTVNPAAKTDKASPLFGMPVLNVEEARTVFTLKRSLGSGFAGVKNTLFEHESNYMVYGDAKKTIEEVIKALKEDG